MDFAPLFLSLQVASGAVILAVPCGIVTAHWMQRHRFRGQDALDTLLLLPLVLPPVMTGLVLLKLLGKHGPLGGWHLLFSPAAAVLASATVAFPLIYQSARAGFASVDARAEDAARSLGATSWRTFWTVTLPLAWPGLGGGALLAYARALGEFGATVMVAGNVAGRTLTAPVAIYFAAESGDFGAAFQYSLVLACFNLIFLTVINRYLRRARISY